MCIVCTDWHILLLRSMHLLVFSPRKEHERSMVESESPRHNETKEQTNEFMVQYVSVSTLSGKSPPPPCSFSCAPSIIDTCVYMYMKTSFIPHGMDFGSHGSGTSFGAVRRQLLQMERQISAQLKL